MRIYFLPTSEEGMDNKVFVALPEDWLYEGGVSTLPVWQFLKNAADKRGVIMETSDKWSRESCREDDILIVQNHPGETWPWRLFYRLKFWKARGGFLLARRKFLYGNYRFFKRRILLQQESPMIMPYTYSRLGGIRKSGIYWKIYLLQDERDGFNYYDYREESVISPYFSAPKDKFLVMINANMTIHSFRGELYGERIKAIKYFSAVPGFDLYGYGWDKAPRHPFHFFDKKYVTRAWRGSVKNKMKTMSQYKFALCFENCVYPSYVSEKIYDCLAAGAIPIYLGAPDIEKFIPPSCFIDFRKFNRDYGKLLEYLDSLGPDALQKYRDSILTFLNEKPNIGKMDGFLEEILR